MLCESGEWVCCVRRESGEVGRLWVGQLVKEKIKKEVEVGVV